MREWWIDERPDVNWDVAFRKKWESTKLIHVIEKSTYDKLEAENEWFRKQASFDAEDFNKERDELRAKCEGLEANLKNKTGMTCSQCGEKYFNFDGAKLYEENARLRAALEKIKEYNEKAKGDMHRKNINWIISSGALSEEGEG